MARHTLAAAAPRRLLTRLLEAPNLAQVVQGLDPRVLHQLVRHCGLEDCGEVIALATTEQLTRIFDDDLWRNDAAGDEEQFDADRFGLWLEVLAEVGPAVAARKIVGMDFDLVTAALSRRMLVLDHESLVTGHGAAAMGLDDDDPARVALTERALEDSPSYEIGGYTVVAKRSESWDALLSVLTSLDHEHHAFFVTLMKRCCRISTEQIADNGGLYEVLTADEQIMADVAGAREERREQEGFVTPSDAAAFLKLARGRSEHDAPLRPDPVTARYFQELERRAKVRGEDAIAKPDHDGALERQVAEFLAGLEAGVPDERRRPLLPAGPAGSGDRLSSIRAQLSFAQEHEGAAYGRRTEELAYLANVLVAGCSFRSRRFRAVEAADAVLAICNLGLENEAGPPPATLPPDLLLRRDLVTVFQTGWRILYEDVCLFVARRLVEVLSELQSDDRDVQAQITDLVRRMRTERDAGTPWRARDDLDVIAILDQPSWAILLDLVDECPVVPKGADVPGGKPALRVSPEFEFVSENRQIAWARDFAESLPQRLLGAATDGAAPIRRRQRGQAG